MDENTNKAYEPTKQKAHVEELKASGAVVRLPGGERVWLPGHEMYLDFKPFDDFRERGEGLVGKDIDVIEFRDPIRSDERLVSHIRATNDPWKDVSSWSEGDVKIMEVVSKTKKQVMGILPSGVRAEVLLKPVQEALESPSWQSFGTPLVGDEIAGFFRKDDVDEQSRTVTLDYAGFIQSRITIKDLFSLYGQETIAASVITDDASARDIESRYELGNVRALRGIDSILLVDDDSVFLYSLEGFLKSRVSKVIACETYDDAVKAVEEYGDDLDLAIIDIHLPKCKKQRLGTGPSEFRDHLGLDLARLILTQHGGCSVVLITGEEIDAQNEKIRKAEDLEVSGLFAKPFGVRDLDLALASAARPPRQLPAFLPGGESPANSQPRKAQSLDEDIGDALDSLREDIGAQGVVLFSIHPVTYAVHIVASSDPSGRFSAIKRKLHRSPVRDAAIDGEDILAHDAAPYKPEFPKHRWLQRAYGYRSCVGTSVSLGRASQEAHALFAFHQQPERFQDEHMSRVRLAAREIGHILASVSMGSELREMKPFELMGKIYGSMAHELTSLFSNQFLLSQLESALESENYSEALKKVRTLHQQSERASDILHTFRTMAKGQHETVVEFDLEESLHYTLDIFRETAKRSGVQLYYDDKTTSSCLVKMRRTGIELIMHNLLLNAVQQIDRLQFLRSDSGEILVELEDETDGDGARWGIIKVHDNGPGIHKQDFSRVFDIHYTTKEEGCGMGLDISRNVARSVEVNGRTGDLEVSRSILLVGTTFEVRLPLQ
jgi:signal transduction histidine kinase/DNA-binding NarL/FixJ family response regulator